MCLHRGVSACQPMLSDSLRVRVHAAESVVVLPSLVHGFLLNACVVVTWPHPQLPPHLCSHVGPFEVVAYPPPPFPPPTLLLLRTLNSYEHPHPPSGMSWDRAALGPVPLGTTLTWPRGSASRARGHVPPALGPAAEAVCPVKGWTAFCRGRLATAWKGGCFAPPSPLVRRSPAATPCIAHTPAVAGVGYLHVWETGSAVHECRLCGAFVC